MPLNRRELLQLFGITVSGALAADLVGCQATPIPTPRPTLPATPQLALVLGGGGAKGFAHIGVLNVLESHGIKPDVIVGTSMGAVVGSLYASGKSAAQLEQIALSVRDDELLDFTLSKQGFIEGVRLQNWINAHVGNRPIERLPIRFISIATDAIDKRKVELSQGDTGLAVRASSSVYGVFIAPRINNRRYLDGGMVSLVPVQTAKDTGARVIVAVDVFAPTDTAQPASHKLQDFWTQLDAALGATPIKDSAELALADVVIRPDVRAIGTANLHAKAAAIRAGEAAAKRALPTLLQQLSAQTRTTPPARPPMPQR